MCCILGYIHVGLKIVINIDQDEYTDKFGEEAGARVVLHAQDKMPFPEDEGILARPGLLTSVGLKRVRVKIIYCVKKY